MRLVISILAFVFLTPVMVRPQSGQSVLANGDWYKIGVTRSGMHQLDAAFLRRAGINPAGINPENIRLFGNGGGMLPQANSASRHDDLTENAILVAGEEDGRFDSNDYILFYAQSPHQTEYNAGTGQFTHRTNLYSDTTFYFLTFGDTPGLRPAAQADFSGAAETVASFDDYFFHEKDLQNIIRSGREWYGEKFDLTTEHHVDFTIPGLMAGQPLKIAAAVMAQSPASGTFSVKLNGQALGNITVPAVGQGTYDVKGANAAGSFEGSATGPNVRVSVSFARTGSAVGYLNRVGVQVKRELRLYGNQTEFQVREGTTAPALRYQVSGGAADMQIWDITNPLLPAKQNFSISGTTALFGAEGGTGRQYIMFRGNSFDNPASIRRAPNQNLHGLPSPDLLIITHAGLLGQAERLATFRRENDGLRAEVVTTEQVYNEFSSGRQDITALRDFIRYLYRKGNSLRYVLLFGDASYDYKSRVANNTNLVPTYESYQSLHPIFSFSSDDYFGFMNDQEGDWPENSAGDHTMDVSVGRLPVRTVREAEAVVSKLIRYAQSPDGPGPWRNQLCFVADDGDGNIHQMDADRLTEQVGNRYGNFNIDKIFMDAFPQQSTPAGQKAPAVSGAIDKAVEQGVLIMNYTGHGGEAGWAQEQVLTLPQIAGWRNRDRLPLFVTATCAFGRYDDPSLVSGAESALLNVRGGAIGLITTTRPVFSNTNYALNVAFYNAIFEPVNGSMPRLGDAMRETKNNSLSGSINRNFSLLGDPSMRLAYPQENIVLTTINGKLLSEGADTLRALSRVVLEGGIQHADGSLANDFSGRLNLVLFDKARTVTTLGDENTRMNFQLRDNRIFEGQATVRNGHFRLEVVVPKDIDYRPGNGRISMYARSTDGLADAGGYDKTIPVGGTAPAVAADQTPPRITLFLNDTTFVNGGVTGPDALLIARLSDESGINISRGGIGHEITARLDGRDEILILNDFYSPFPDDYRRGDVRFPLQNLTPGRHRLSLTAWDTHNNPATVSIEFVVANAVSLSEVANSPNPFSGKTTFRYRHDRPDDDLQVEISIYTATGLLVTVLKGGEGEQMGEYGEIRWDGRGTGGKKLPAGVYVYRLSVRSKADNAEAVHSSRLVLFR